MAWSLLLNSLPAHKEFRFLLPALQLLMPYAGAALAQLAEAMSAQTQHFNCWQAAPSFRTADGAPLSKKLVDCGAGTSHVQNEGHAACSACGEEHRATSNIIGGALEQHWPAGLDHIGTAPSAVGGGQAHASGAAATQAVAAQCTSASRVQPDCRHQRGRRRTLALAAGAACLCLAAQPLLAAYFCTVHQR